MNGLRGAMKGGTTEHPGQPDHDAFQATLLTLAPLSTRVARPPVDTSLSPHLATTASRPTTSSSVDCFFDWPHHFILSVSDASERFRRDPTFSQAIIDCSTLP
uniref:Uncharacterized protein n=1 Tax=Plectus sambesii TaxID=2011161 RepID=A0A914VQ83_9BILA